MKNKVTSRDRGAKALQRRLAVSGEVTVGIHEADGAQPKEGKDAAEGSLLEVALVHEFGSEKANIPERSFIRAWVDENESAHAEQARKMGKAVILGKLDTETAMKRLGVLRQAECQKRISDGIDPELEDATKERKGSSVPLIDTGQLRTGITHEIKVGK